MNWRLRKLRCRLYDRRLLAAVVVVCLLSTGGWLSYTAHVAPEERTETRERTAWELTGAVSHGADITEPTPIYPEMMDMADSDTDEWPTDENDDSAADRNGNTTAQETGNTTGSPVGTVTDEPLYYADIAPVAHGEIAVEHTASEAVTVGIELRRVTRATDDGTVYWTDKEQLGRIQRDVSASDAVSVPFELNVSAVADRVDEIESQIGASPGETETRLRADVTVDGTVDGDTVSMARTLQVDVDRDSSTYRFDIHEPLDEPVRVTESVAAERSYGPVWTAGGPFLAAVGALGGISLVVVSLVGRPTPAERAWLDYRSDRSEYAPLVVDASLPAAATGRPEAQVETLGALCGLAVDAGTVVVYDNGFDRYVVCHDGLLYVYQPPQPPT